MSAAFALEAQQLGKSYRRYASPLRRAFSLLQKKVPDLPENFRDEAQEVLAAEKEILARAEAWRPWRSYAAMHLWRSL